MGHPRFPDPPSRDMTKAQERQRELGAQIEAFLSRGGQIKAFDQLARPIESTPWQSRSIKPERQIAATQLKAKRARPVKHTPAPAPTEPETARQDDQALAAKIIMAAALGDSARVIARDLQIPLPRCRAIARQCHVQFRA